MLLKLLSWLRQLTGDVFCQTDIAARHSKGHVTTASAEGHASDTWEGQSDDHPQCHAPTALCKAKRQ